MISFGPSVSRTSLNAPQRKIQQSLRARYRTVGPPRGPAPKALSKVLSRVEADSASAEGTALLTSTTNRAAPCFKTSSSLRAQNVSHLHLLKSSKTRRPSP